MKLKSLDYVDIIESFTNRYEHIVKKMRFQQRQQQELDQRKVEMVSSTKTVAAAAITTSGTASSSSSTIRTSATAIHTTASSHHSAAQQQVDLSASLGAGKVRQMFDERRHHKAAGIDKSYPLQPIGQVVKNGGSTVSPPAKMATTANGMNNKTRVPPISANTKARLARQQQQENGNGEAPSKSGGAATFDDNENLLEDEKFPDTISFDEDLTLTSTGTPLGRKLPNVGKLTTPNGGSTPPQNVNSLKLKPVPGRTPTTTTLKATTAAAPKKVTPAVAPSTNPSSSPSPRGSQPSSAKSRASTAKSGTGMSATVPGSRKASAASIASGSIASGITLDSGPVPDGMARCSVCGRNFAEDRIAKHMEICRKTKSKKRKV